jgi:hypothetical protein
MEAFELALTTIMLLVVTYILVWILLGATIESYEIVHVTSAITAVTASVVYAYYESRRW